MTFNGYRCLKIDTCTFVQIMTCVFRVFELRYCCYYFTLYCLCLFFPILSAVLCYTRFNATATAASLATSVAIAAASLGISCHLSRICLLLVIAVVVMPHRVIFGFSPNMQTQQRIREWREGAEANTMWSTSSSARRATMVATGLHVTSLSLSPACHLASTWPKQGAASCCLFVCLA